MTPSTSDKRPEARVSAGEALVKGFGERDDSPGWSRWPWSFRFAIPALLLTFYTGLLLVVPPREAIPAEWHAGWLSMRRSLVSLIESAVEQTAGERGTRALSRSAERHVTNAAYYLVVMAIVPWLGMTVLRRGRPREFGMRPPNRYGWRLLIVAYLLSLPFLYWMVRSPSFISYYIRDLRSSPATFLAGYVVTMFGEHVLLHGVVLALGYTHWRWPSRADVAQGKTEEPSNDPVAGHAGGTALALLRWLGLAQSRGEAGNWGAVVRWLGLPDRVTAAVLLSTFLFALVHWGKDPREFFLSIPGGLASACLAYRGDSCLVPFLLHLATAGTACLLMVAFAPA